MVLLLSHTNGIHPIYRFAIRELFVGQPIYEKSAIQLLKDFAQQHFASGQVVFSQQDVRGWIARHYPDLSEERIRTNLTILSTNSPARRRHPVHNNGSNDVLFALEDGTYRAYCPASDPPPLSGQSSNNTAASTELVPKALEGWKFDQERVLQSYLVHNLDTIEPGLILHQENGVPGIEYPCGSRRIDILARDSKGAWVIIELKADKAHDRVVGQIALYMQWIRENVAGSGEQVRGIILAHRISSELQLASRLISNLQVKEYAFYFNVYSGLERNIAPSIRP